jgi:plastocyanin
MTRRTTAYPAALAALAIVLAACTSTAAPTDDDPTAEATPTATAEATAEETAEPSASEDETAEERVRIRRSQFDPAELTVAVGTEVVFVNGDAFAHTVTHGTDGQPVDDPIVDEEIEQNGSVRVVFDEPGTYDITCGIHPSMQMTITVEG